MTDILLSLHPIRSLRDRYQSGRRLTFGGYCQGGDTWQAVGQLSPVFPELSRLPNTINTHNDPCRTTDFSARSILNQDLSRPQEFSQQPAMPEPIRSVNDSKARRCRDHTCRGVGQPSSHVRRSIPAMNQPATLACPGHQLPPGVHRPCQQQPRVPCLARSVEQADRTAFDIERPAWLPADRGIATHIVVGDLTSGIWAPSGYLIWPSASMAALALTRPGLSCRRPIRHQRRDRQGDGARERYCPEQLLQIWSDTGALPISTLSRCATTTRRHRRHALSARPAGGQGSQPGIATPAWSNRNRCAPDCAHEKSAETGNFHWCTFGTPAGRRPLPPCGRRKRAAHFGVSSTSTTRVHLAQPEADGEFSAWPGDGSASQSA